MMFSVPPARQSGNNRTPASDHCRLRASGARHIFRFAGAAAFVALGAGWGEAAFAVEAPPGMILYDHPVYSHGRLLLWHGPSHGGLVAKSAAKIAPKAVAVAAPKNDYSVVFEAGDGAAARIASDIVATMQEGASHGTAIAGSVTADGLTKDVANDRANFALAPLDSIMVASHAPLDWRDIAPYVARLPSEAIIIIAPRETAEFGQLNGRRISIGGAGTAGAESANLLFQRLGFNAKLSNENFAEGLKALAAGKLDAVVAIGAIGDKDLAAFGADGKFHLVPMPYLATLRNVYSSAQLTAHDLPFLIGADEKLATLAEPMVLMALDARPDSTRLAAAERLTKKFLSDFDHLLAPDHDSSWSAVNFSSELPQWPRLKAAQEWVGAKSAQSTPGVEDFRNLAKTMVSANAVLTGADADRLYDSLMQWQSAKP